MVEDPIGERRPEFKLAVALYIALGGISGNPDRTRKVGIMSGLATIRPDRDPLGSRLVFLTVLPSHGAA